MPVTVLSSAVTGLEAFLVSVEVDLLPGIPSFTIGGLGDAAVHEARDRIRSAIRHSGFSFPVQKKVINLAPARMRKHGAAFDVPMAIGLLAASGQVQKERLWNMLFLGELALDGAVRAIPGVLPMVHRAKQLGLRGVVVPRGNREEAALCDGIPLFPVTNLREAVSVCMDGQQAYQKKSMAPAAAHRNLLSHIQGHAAIKRALAIAAAGFHSVLLVGPPGTGKTMLARAVQSLLPPLSLSETVAVTAIHSVAGLLHEGAPVVRERPFRSVHATVSRAALLGGGSGAARPGELSLAHRGVLFFDELGEGERGTLEALRQPLEEREIVLGRSPAVRFPADVLFVGAMNPCPCGFRGDAAKRCQCGSRDLARYQRNISGPLLDRIDFVVSVPRISTTELSEHRQEDDAPLRTKVRLAWNTQQQRCSKHNSRMEPSDLSRFCAIPPAGRRLLEQAAHRFSLSPRAYHRILKVARTIADMEGAADIVDAHVAEAISYRVQSLF